MELIDKILSTGIHEAVKVYDSELRKLGRELYNINCGSCGNRLIEIYLKLSKNGKQIIENMKNRQARLKKGVLLRVPQMGITWTNDSLDFTDENALKVLKKYKLLETRFEVLPEGLEPTGKTERELLLEEAEKLNLTHAKNITIPKLKELIKAKKDADVKIKLELDTLKEEAIALEIEIPEEIGFDALKALIEGVKTKAAEEVLVAAQIEAEELGITLEEGLELDAIQTLITAKKAETPVD